jgi:hypothetical protein
MRERAVAQEESLHERAQELYDFVNARLTNRALVGRNESRVPRPAVSAIYVARTYIGTPFYHVVNI